MAGAASLAGGGARRQPRRQRRRARRAARSRPCCRREPVARAPRPPAGRLSDGSHPAVARDNALRAPRVQKSAATVFRQQRARRARKRGAESAERGKRARRRRRRACGSRPDHFSSGSHAGREAPGVRCLLRATCVPAVCRAPLLCGSSCSCRVPVFVRMLCCATCPPALYVYVHQYVMCMSVRACASIRPSVIPAKTHALAHTHTQTHTHKHRWGEVHSGIMASARESGGRWVRSYLVLDEDNCLHAFLSPHSLESLIVLP